jgi:putative AdoMet-dependent methyltransferase
MEDRRTLFDEWAEHYDASVDDESGFPFTGYRDALATTLSAINLTPGQSVLDVGCGTGNLSLLFALAGCSVTGVDFSPAMLERARQRVPGARFLALDLLGSWNPIAGQRFDVVASAYVFHEFDLEIRLSIIARLVEEHLKPGGRVVVADLSFTTRADMDATQAELKGIWDDEEFYWSAEEAVPAIRRRGFSVAYTPVPPFAGVYVIASACT